MSEILLQALSNADIDWMVTTGERIRLEVGDVLISAEKPVSELYVLLEGSLVASSPASTECASREIATFSRGELLGESCLLEISPRAATIKAAEPSLVLVLSRAKLTEKLLQDMGFSAHLYQAIALILSERLRYLFEQQADNLAEQVEMRYGGDRSVKEALFVFGELWDSDVDWLLAVGHLQKLAVGEVLLQASRPVDALYIIMDGRLSISKPEGQLNPLSLCFTGLEKSTRSQKVFANISKGGLPGITSFLDFRPQPVTIRAEIESLIFAIPRSKLLARLQEDSGFASRFYRVIAVQVAELLQTVMGQLGCSGMKYEPQAGMDNAMEYEDELDMDALHQMSHGAARFNWMLKQLGVS